MWFRKLTLHVAFVAACTAMPAAAQISAQLFDLSLDGPSLFVWPVDSFNGIRLLGNGTSWQEVNTAEGVYDWSGLEYWLAAANSHHNDVLYTFTAVPQWASSEPNDTSCKQGPGTCDPPNDLNSDGSGTDQHWKDFVNALATYSQSSVSGHIQYWEMWNEPHNSFFWNGTDAQLVRMVSDAFAIIKAVDPNAVILSPTMGWINRSSLTWASGYLAAGGANYMDAVAVHGYVFQTQNGVKTDYPETMVSLFAPYQSLLNSYGLGDKQIFDTESSWSLNGHWGAYSSDPDLQAAFVARLYLLHAAYGIVRLYWFEWNDPSDGTLWLPNPAAPSGPGTLQEAGVAYQQIYNWLVGNSMPTGCSQSGTVWTCSITGAKGYLAEAVWDTSQTCSGGTCTSSSYKVGSSYSQYQTLSGATVTITGGTVPIGAKPILLEN